MAKQMPASLPMVFDLNTALWFNEYFVTADVAEPEDLETWLEVGAHEWMWFAEFSAGVLSLATGVGRRMGAVAGSAAEPTPAA